MAGLFNLGTFHRRLSPFGRLRHSLPRWSQARSGLASPLDDSGCADVGLFLMGRKACKTAQEIFCVAESEAGGTSHGEVGFNGLDHRFTSGHG